MCRIEAVRDIIEYQDGKAVAVLDLQVSTAADLPDIGDAIGQYIVAAGSTAQIVQAETPTFVTLDDDTTTGTWYPEQS